MCYSLVKSCCGRCREDENDVPEGSCYCDDECWYFEDCCDDYEGVCEDLTKTW